MTRRPAAAGLSPLGRQAENGFTLVELLVALALIGMASALLLAGLGTGRNIWGRAEARVASGEQIVAAHSLLRDRIEHLFAETRYDASAPYVDVQGNRDFVGFYAAPTAAMRPAGMQRFRVSLSRAGVLTMYSTPAQGSRVEPREVNMTGWRADPLLDGVRSVTFSFFGPGPPDGARRWRDEWRDRPSAPELIRLRVAFEPGDRRRWPDLIVRPAATLGTACQLDPLTGRCQGQA